MDIDETAAFKFAVIAEQNRLFRISDHLLFKRNIIGVKSHNPFVQVNGVGADECDVAVHLLQILLCVGAVAGKLAIAQLTSQNKNFCIFQKIKIVNITQVIRYD